MTSHSMPADARTPELTRAQVAVLTTEVRTLQERLIILRARDAALEQKVRQQTHDLEKYANTLFCLTEELRKNQNLTVSFQDHVGLLLVQRGRWLLSEYQGAAPAERLKVGLRVREFLDFQRHLSEAVYRHPDWAELRTQLEAVEAQHRELVQHDARRFSRRVGRFLARWNPLAA